MIERHNELAPLINDIIAGSAAWGGVLVWRKLIGRAAAFRLSAGIAAAAAIAVLLILGKTLIG